MNLSEKGKVETVKASIKWEIPNFCISCSEIGKGISSPLFSLNQREWFIELYPKGENADVKEFVSVYLFLNSGNNIEAGCRISVLDIENKKYETLGLLGDFLKFTVCEGIGFNMLIKHCELLENKSRLLPDDTLRILCEITMGRTIYRDKEINKNRGCKRPRLDSVADLKITSMNKQSFKMLFNNEKLSDVKILCTSNEEIYAHKAILVTQSEVFQTIFMSSTNNDKQDVIEIKDFEYEVLREMFSYIYTGKVGDICKFAIKLLAPAQKYLLKDLSLLCEEYLCDNLSATNAVEYLSHAESYGLSNLKKKAIDFIASNMKDMVNVPEFEEITSLRADTILNIFHSCASQGE